MKLLEEHKKQMVLMMLTGAFAIFFTGFVHVWAIYQPYVIQATGWSSTQASLCFYLSNCIFVFGNIIGGRIQDRYNPRMVAFVGGALFTFGVIGSSFLLISTPIPMYLTFGVMQGLGQGMIYSVILSTAQKWFPGRTGFASGVIVTANGLCAFFLAPISRVLLDKAGPSKTLLMVGSVIALAWILVSVFLVVPKAEWFEERTKTNPEILKELSQPGKQYESREMICTKKFYFMVLSMMCGLIPYYLLSPISQTIQIDQGIVATIAVGSVMCGSILNAITRLMLPTLADKVGRIRCIRIILVLSLIAMLMLTFFEGYAITVAVVFMYICFGGIMGNFPSLASSVFGMEHFGENYGYIMLGMVIASMGSPVISNIIMGHGSNLHVLFAFGAGFSALAIIFLSFLNKSLGEETV